MKNRIVKVKSVFTILFLVTAFTFLGAVHPPKADAVIAPNPPPAGGMPGYIYGPGPNTMISCDSQPNSPWLGEWLAVGGSPTVTSVTVANGSTAPINLGFFWSGMVCHNTLPGVTNTRIHIAAVYNGNVANLNNDEMNLDFTPSYLTPGTYRGTADPFVYNAPPGGFTDTTPGFYDSVPVGFKMVNRFANNVYRCVLPIGISSWPPVASLDDWNSCPATNISFTINITVLPPPSPDRPPEVRVTADCTAQTATIRVRDPDGGPLAMHYRIYQTLTPPTPWINSSSKAAGPNVWVSWSVSLSPYAQTKRWRIDAQSRGHPPPGATLGPWISDHTIVDPCPTANPSDFSCSVSPISVEINVSTPFQFVVHNNSSSGGVTISKAAGNAMNIIVRDPSGVIVYNGTNVDYGQPPPGPNPAPVPPGGAGYHYHTMTLPVGGAYTVEMTISGVGSGPIGTCDASATVIIASNRPYVSFYNGDQIAGGAFAGGDCTALKNITTLTQPDGRGSGSQLAALDLGDITGYTSAYLHSAASPNPPPDGLKMANITAKGSFGGQHCVKDYFSGLSLGSLPTFSGNDVSTVGGSGPYYFTGSTLHGTVPNTPTAQRIILYADHDVTIDNAITYAGSGSWSSPSQIPSLYLIVKGNIYVNKSVGQLDGAYVAQPNDPTIDTAANGGRIYTCTNGSSIMPASSLVGQCSSQLTVNGAFIAQVVKFQRVKNSLRDAQPPGSAAEYSNRKAAEVFRYTPELYLAGPQLPNTGSTSSGIYDAIANLPPIL